MEKIQDYIDVPSYLWGIFALKFSTEGNKFFFFKTAKRVAKKMTSIYNINYIFNILSHLQINIKQINIIYKLLANSYVRLEDKQKKYGIYKSLRYVNDAQFIEVRTPFKLEMLYDILVSLNRGVVLHPLENRFINIIGLYIFEY